MVGKRMMMQTIKTRRIFPLKLYLLIVLLLSVCSISKVTHAQFEKDYTPVKYSYSGSKQTEKVFMKKLKLKYISTDKGLVQDFNKYIYGLHIAYAQSSKNKEFIIEPYVKKYLQKIIDTVVTLNKLGDKYEVVCTRYTVPNAYNMGDNKLFVNIGILKHLENEAQLAFLLCHELSHQLLLHVQENFAEARKRQKDKSIKREIKDINRAKYNKLDRAVQFLKNQEYDFAKYSRAKERAADSMAAVLLLATAYDAREGKSLMQILDKSDTDATVISYPNYFDGDSAKILPQWLSAKTGLLEFGHRDVIEFDKDSVKTHPDIPNRIRMIDSQLRMTKYDYQGKTLYLQSKATFDSIVAMARFEEIETFVKRKRYGAMVFYSLSALQKFPENTYLLKHAATALNHLQKAVKNHTVQDFIPIESDELPEAYNQFLRLIDRTTYVEFRRLVYQFLQRYSSKIMSYPEVKTIYENYYK